MLSKQDNEMMCRVGAETPMGEAMRKFWIPALLSSELPEPDGDPVHVELLGQSFVAFRDSNGQVGVLDEFCPHRGASLTIGRVENCGIRCIYHGWLFATDGRVLETPNVEDPQFKARFRTRAYPVHEGGGFVWVYIGDEATKPPLPDFPWMDAPERMRLNTCQVNGCNYVQLLEGLLDSSHLTLLHCQVLKKNTDSDLNFAKATSHMQHDAMPKVEAEETNFGLHYAAVRTVDGRAETRVTAFISPFWVLNPNGDIAIAVVPMSDTKSAFYTIFWDGEKAYGEEPLRSKQLKMIGFDQETLAEYGQTRASFGGPNTMRRDNRWGQDRALMREGHFSGVPTLALEDSLVCLSAGPLRDRSVEYLAGVDAAIALLYRVLLKNARLAREGREPIGHGRSVTKLRGVNASLEPGSEWRRLVPDHEPARAPLRAVGA